MVESRRKGPGGTGVETDSFKRPPKHDLQNAFSGHTTIVSDRPLIATELHKDLSLCALLIKNTLSRSMIRLVTFDALHTIITLRYPIYVQYSQVFEPYLGSLPPESIKQSFNVGTQKC